MMQPSFRLANRHFLLTTKRRTLPGMWRRCAFIGILFVGACSGGDVEGSTPEDDAQAPVPAELPVHEAVPIPGQDPDLLRPYGELEELPGQDPSLLWPYETEE